MVRRLILVLLLLVFWPSYVVGQVEIMDALLPNFGFTPVGVVTVGGGVKLTGYVTVGCLTGYATDDFGALRATVVSFYPGYDTNAYRGLGVAYATVQARMGKLGNLLSSRGALLRKGRYLLDTVGHNLRHNESTTFVFDDMTVYATKDRERAGVIVVMEPRW